jgi:ATP-dependent HslUV protease ATP-binding subunit HslU
LLKTEGPEHRGSRPGIKRLAEIAWRVNEETENIGAVACTPCSERLLEEVSFSAGDLASAHSEHRSY